MARKAKPKQTDPLETLFTTPPVTEGTETQTEGAKTPSVEDLLEQIKALNERVDKADRTNLALMTAPPQVPQSVVQPQGPKGLDFKGLPDPSMDPEGFTKASQERVQAYVSELIKNSQEIDAQRGSQKEQVDALWNRFSSEYADYAADREKVEFAASKVAHTARTRGMDINKYMFGAGQEIFLKDVKETMDRVFGAPKSKEQDDDEGVDDNSRALSIFGGQESGGRMGSKPPEEAGDMLKDIQEIQRKTGLY